MSDYDAASTRAADLDSAVTQNATLISSQYADLVSLSARQAFGGIEISVSNGTDGEWNMSDVKIFLRDVGTSRSVMTDFCALLDLNAFSCSRVNPVETLYSAFPMFLYFNTSFGGPLLTPLLEFQDSLQYTQEYAARDLGKLSSVWETKVLTSVLGTTYPIATGSDVTHQQGIERMHALANDIEMILSTHIMLRIRQYVDHGLGPRKIFWRWLAHLQTCG